MKSTMKIEGPLDIIQFISSNEKLYNFLEYLFKKAAEFNEKHKEEMGENFFPVVSYSEINHAYSVEYEFFVDTLIDYAREVYGVSDDECLLIHQYLF